jgi:outer membrane protein assembly factor BamB
VRRERTLLLVGGIAALCCALVAAAIAASRPASTGGGRRPPIAVVLIPRIEGSELVSVELGSGRIVGRVRLRSLATDMEADADRGTIVAAQTGGVAGSADDALSITDPWSGEARYLKLPRIDPSQVECVAGKAMVLHALVDPDGFVVSGVDPGSGRMVVEGHAPDGTGLWATAAGALWTAVPTVGPDPLALLRIDPTTLAATPGPALGFSPYGVAMAGDRIVVLGGEGTGGAARARIALVDAGTMSVSASATVPGLPHGAQIAVSIGDVLVVGDWNGDAPETGTLQVLDRLSLRPLRAIDVGGAPCALASYADRLLVVDRVSGILSSIDPVTGVTMWRADLGERELVCSKVVVLTYPPASHSSTARSTP